MFLSEDSVYMMKCKMCLMLQYMFKGIGLRERGQNKIPK